MLIDALRQAGLYEGVNKHVMVPYQGSYVFITTSGLRAKLDKIQTQVERSFDDLIRRDYKKTRKLRLNFTTLYGTYPSLDEKRIVADALEYVFRLGNVPQPTPHWRNFTDSLWWWTLRFENVDTEQFLADLDKIIADYPSPIIPNESVVIDKSGEYNKYLLDGQVVPMAFSDGPKKKKA